MINIRYHLVSLTAVVLAVAVGTGLGTATLSGPLAEDLHDDSRSLRGSNARLHDKVADLEDELAARDAYVEEAAPLLLEHRLTGKRMLLVAMPGAGSAAVAGVAEDLRLADATVTGTVRFTDTFTDPQSREDARDLATRLLPPNVDEVSSDDDGVTASAALLAAVLVAHRPAVTAGDRTSVLTGFRAGKLIEYDERITQPAQGVVIVTGPPVTKPAATAEDRNTAVLSAIERFGTAGPLVVAAPGTGGKGNPVSAVRTDPALRKAMSTVDNVGTSLGQLSAVLALVQVAVDRRTGHYGVHDGADRRLPQPE